MTLYTLSIHQVEKQLRNLIARTQDTEQPIVFTTEETAEPVAVLVNSNLFALLQKREQQLFHLRLQELQRQLDHLAQSPSIGSNLAPLIAAFQQAARTLWSICPKPQQSLCVTFVMAVRRLTPDPRFSEQLAVLATGIDLLREDQPNSERIAVYRQALFACGLPPTMGGDNQLAQLYLPSMQTDDIFAATEKAKREARTRLEDQGIAALALEQTHRVESVERHRQWQASLDRTTFYDHHFQA